MTPSSIDERVAAREGELAAQRTRVVAAVMAASLTIPSLYALFVAFDALAAGSVLGTQLASLATYALLRSGRLPMRRAGAVMAFVHVAFIATTAVFLTRYAAIGYLSIAGLAILAYGAVQLERAPFLGALAIDTVVLVASCRAIDQLGVVEGMTLFASFALAVLVHVASVRSTRSAEEQRARAEESARALEVALADARHQIRERERAEAERAQMQERLVEAHRMEAIGTLAGGFAHDMNNLLTGILGLASMVRDQSEDEVQQDAEEIIASVKRGAELTQNLLTIGRRRPTRRDPTSLEKIVSQVASLLSRTLPKRIRLDVALDGELTLLGDASQLEQALVHLCLNASDAMPEGGTLKIAARSEVLDKPRAERLGLSPGRYVVLEVKDEGLGMEPETVRRMFEPFFTTKEPGRGTGMGLAVVYGTVHGHEGALDVTSAPGVGTSILAYLPAEGAAEAAKEARSQRSATRPRPGPVLVIDDDPLLRTTTRRMLEKAGFEVLLAESGERGLEVFRERRDVVVLLDLAMPGMDGPETFRRLREIDPDARVLLTSGYAFGKDVQACLEAGARGFLEKPYEPGALVSALHGARRDVTPSRAHHA